MYKEFQVFVPGKPVGQPRPQVVQKNGKAWAYTPKVADEWKKEVCNAVAPLVIHQTLGPVVVYLDFYFSRPNSHLEVKEGALCLKDESTIEHIIKPDIDNLTKAVLDAISSTGLWKDDCQINRIQITKHYEDDTHKPGVQIYIAWTV